MIDLQILIFLLIFNDEQLDFAESVGWLAPGDMAAVKEGETYSTAAAALFSIPILIFFHNPWHVWQRTY